MVMLEADAAMPPGRMLYKVRPPPSSTAWAQPEVGPHPPFWKPGFFENLSSTGAGCEGRLGLKKPFLNLIMETPPVLCTFGWRVAELSLARCEAVYTDAD
jgi:hypothetical protein